MSYAANRVTLLRIMTACLGVFEGWKVLHAPESATERVLSPHSHRLRGTHRTGGVPDHDWGLVSSLASRLNLFPLLTMF